MNPRSRTVNFWDSPWVLGVALLHDTRCKHLRVIIQIFSLWRFFCVLGGVMFCLPFFVLNCRSLLINYFLEMHSITKLICCFGVIFITVGKNVSNHTISCQVSPLLATDRCQVFLLASLLAMGHTGLVTAIPP